MHHKQSMSITLQHKKNETKTKYQQQLPVQKNWEQHSGNDKKTVI